jgi:hypothetical protein
MSWLAGLHLLFRRTDGAAPPIAGFLPIGLDVPDAMPRVEVRGDREIALVFDRAPGIAPAPGDWQPPGVVRNPRMEAAGEDLWGVTFAIEYLDGRNNLTTRRITLRELYRSDDGVLYLQSFCHERQLRRSFRFDRIQSVIDLDGEVHEPRRFFESELHFPIDDHATSPAAPARARRMPQVVVTPAAPVGALPGRAQRFAARDGLRVLAALGRSDGFLDDAEIGVILDYVIERAAADGVATDDEDRAALLPYLRRQYPRASVLGECLDRLEAEPEVQRRLFLRHAVALMDADGIQHPAEFDMLLGLKERL